MNERTLQSLKKFSLEGRTGIITGSSSGLGLAMAKVLADAGAHIYGLNRTVRQENAYPGVEQIQVDITDRQKLNSIVTEIGSRQGIDFIINNAGITQREKAQDIAEELWLKIHETNLNSLFYLSQAAYPYLKASAHIGRIVNIASMASYMGFSEVTPYCSSKSAVRGVTRGLAVDWRKDNILVNSISPGWFPSKMSQQVMDEERRASILRKIALGAFGAPEEIGNMALFLVSDASVYITGQDFAVDGGATIFGF